MKNWNRFRAKETLKSVLNWTINKSLQMMHSWENSNCRWAKEERINEIKVHVMACAIASVKRVEWIPFVRFSPISLFSWRFLSFSSLAISRAMSRCCVDNDKHFLPLFACEKTKGESNCESLTGEEGLFRFEWKNHENTFVYQTKWTNCEKAFEKNVMRFLEQTFIFPVTSRDAGHRTSSLRSIGISWTTNSERCDRFYRFQQNKQERCWTI